MDFKDKVRMFLNEENKNPYSKEEFEIKGNRMLFSDSKGSSEITIFMEFFKEGKPVNPTKLMSDPKWLARFIGKAFDYKTKELAKNLDLGASFNQRKIAKQEFWEMRENKAGKEVYLKSVPDEYEIRISTERVQGIPLRAGYKSKKKFDDFK